MNESAENFAEMVDILIRSPAQEPSMHMNVKLRTEWDTASLLIHMGRDHGLAGYPKWFEYCKNVSFTGNLEQFSQVGMNREGMKILETLYRLVLLFMWQVIFVFTKKSFIQAILKISTYWLE